MTQKNPQQPHDEPHKEASCSFIPKRLMPTKARIELDFAFLGGLFCELGEASKRRAKPASLFGLHPATLAALLRGQSHQAGPKP